MIGRPVARIFLGQAIDIGHQAVAFLDIFAADGFLFRAMDPDLLRVATLGVVVPHNRV